MAPCCENYGRVLWGSNRAKIISAVILVVLITGIIMAAASGPQKTCPDGCYESSCTDKGTHYQCICPDGGSTWCKDKEFPKGSTGYYGYMLIGFSLIGLAIQCFTGEGMQRRFDTVGLALATDKKKTTACCCPPQPSPTQPYAETTSPSNVPVAMPPMYAPQGYPYQDTQNPYPAQQQQEQQQPYVYAQGAYPPPVPYSPEGYMYPQQQQQQPQLQPPPYAPNQEGAEQA